MRARISPAHVTNASGEGLEKMLMQQGYLRTAYAARYLGIGHSTLERMRVGGTGPKWRRLGAKIVVYAISDLDEWASQQVRTSTSEKAVA